MGRHQDMERSFACQQASLCKRPHEVRISGHNPRACCRCGREGCLKRVWKTNIDFRSSTGRLPCPAWDGRSCRSLLNERTGGSLNRSTPLSEACSPRLVNMHVEVVVEARGRDLEPRSSHHWPLWRGSPVCAREACWTNEGGGPATQKTVVERVGCVTRRLDLQRINEWFRDFRRSLRA
jgi:hypothetical protein